jgi:hypothetical protein
MAGAVLLPLCFLAGIQFGIIGLAWAWLIGFPLYTAATVAVALPVIGAPLAGLARAIAPALLAASAMAVAVLGLDLLLPPMGAGARLAILVPFGAATYCGLLFAFARPLVEDVLALVLRRRPLAGA